MKRFVELRRPYLHIHSVGDGEEVAIISLRNSRIDSQPGVVGLLGGRADDTDSQASGGEEFRPTHRRTSSGRIISSIWTGSGGGGGPNGGLQRLSERLQAGVFAIYAPDNTWLFAARSERDKTEWIFRIDQSYVSNGGSADGSGAASPAPGGFGQDVGY